MSAQAYTLKKQRAAARSKAAVLAGQDIGAIPPVKDPMRRELADGDFRIFCESYFPLLFTLGWSDDHLRVMAKIEQAVKGGGMFAMAMPRGSGKTTLCQAAVLWALLTGRQQFVFFICATAEYASGALENLKHHLSGNALLLEDYPEAIYPIRCLEGESRRCSGQRYYGRLTHIGWTSEEIILPTIPGSPCSGALVRTAGLLGNIRGSLHIRPDGSSVRPTFVVIDDPQTDGSARSPSQVHERLAVINGAILNLAGPGKRIAAVMPCTVIRKDDLADQVLDRDKSPEWQGERTKLVYQFPTNDRLWSEYARLRADSLRNDGDGRHATEFYRDHKSEMDAGAIVAWRDRYNKATELSAIQHAMNLKLRDEAAFWAEYQNEPLPDQDPDAEMLSAAEIAAKTNGHRRGEVPAGVTHLTAFIDVQGSLLYWMVCGWEEDFTGYVIDYGAYPDQKRGYFTLRDAKRTLQTVHKGSGLEGAIYAGLTAAVAQICDREYTTDDGGTLKVERLMIDANWGNSTDVVYQFCRQDEHAAILTPSHGRYVGASGQPFDEYKRKPGDRIGLHWRIPTTRGLRKIRHAIIDTNYWKSFAHARLLVAKGDPSCLSLFTPGPASDHAMLSEHLTSEYRVRTQGRGRTVDEWKLKPNKPDNHWLDCLVGCLVGASMLGVKRGVDPLVNVTRKRMSFAEMQRRKRERKETA